MVEAKLRAEVFSLRRNNATLTKRTSQLQGLLGELQPLWWGAHSDVQDQVQLALEMHTPRPGVCASALASLPEEAELDSPDTEISPVRPASSSRLTSTQEVHSPMGDIRTWAERRHQLDTRISKERVPEMHAAVPRLSLPGSGGLTPRRLSLQGNGAFTPRQSNLARQVSQLQALLVELQPLWLSAPSDVQEQVRLALEMQTPRPGVCASAMASLPEEFQLHASDAQRGEQIERQDGSMSSAPSPPNSTEAEVMSGRDPHLKMEMECAGTVATADRNCVVIPRLALPGTGSSVPENQCTINRRNTRTGESRPSWQNRTVEQSSAACEEDSDSNYESDSDSDSASCVAGLTPPNTARHRMDDSDEGSGDDESIGVDEARIGDVMVAAETYNEVLRALREEIAARKGLEQQLAELSGAGGNESIGSPASANAKDTATTTFSSCADNPTTPATVDTMTPSPNNEWSPESALEFHMSDDEAEPLVPLPREVFEPECSMQTRVKALKISAISPLKSSRSTASPMVPRGPMGPWWRTHSSPTRSARSATTPNGQPLAPRGHMTQLKTLPASKGYATSAITPDAKPRDWNEVAQEWSPESWAGWTAPNDGFFDFDEEDEVLYTARGSLVCHELF